jgi:hypothetical protein
MGLAREKMGECYDSGAIGFRDGSEMGVEGSEIENNNNNEKYGAFHGFGGSGVNWNGSLRCCSASLHSDSASSFS